MPILLSQRRVAIAGLAAAMLAVLAANAPIVAATRQVSVESLIYDLKHPDPLRRQAAARVDRRAMRVPRADPTASPVMNAAVIVANA